MVTTAEAVGELVGVAYKLHGGTGDAVSRILRPRKTRKGTKKGMQIYIAGKITGLSGEEAEGMFMMAETMLEKKGHTPLNPLALVDQDPDRTYEDYLLDALEIVLCSAEALYMLPNWRDSLGARIEHAIAVEKRLPIYYAATELPGA